jgi:phytoene dehydrogenase-like protein
VRRGGERRWDAVAEAFGDGGLGFWRWQEQTADAMWDLALRLLPWPPRGLGEVIELARGGASWLAGAPRSRATPGLAADALRPVAAHLPARLERMRLFVDAQLLISAQAESDRVNALYGAAALDLPRRGVVHLAGGMGAIGETLADAATRHGARIFRKAPVRAVSRSRGGGWLVRSAKGDHLADVVILNVTPSAARSLLSPPPRALAGSTTPLDGWGALVVHAGVDDALAPADGVLHHQVIAGRPLGEGNSVFASISPRWDATRAPAGRRALTVSTHTRLGPWWRLVLTDPGRYAAEKEAVARKMLELVDRAMPGVARGAEPAMVGTPVTFARYTMRHDGWVGGYPQTHLARPAPARVDRDVWLVGDSVFPGQSTAAAALGGVRVALAALATAAVPKGGVQ